jgi:hypothetical protein
MNETNLLMIFGGMILFALVTLAIDIIGRRQERKASRR